MTFLYALATLLPKSEHSRSIIYSKTFKPAAKGHKLVCVRQAFLTIIFCFILFSDPVNAQKLRKDSGANGPLEIQPLIVGQRVPDDFWTREHLFYIDGDTVRRTLEEYKGKLLVMDFWATWCGACRVNFPKLEQLKQQFGSDVNFILVNPLEYRDGIDKIKKAYEDFDISGGSTLPTIILDEYIIALFPHLGIPRYVWINPKGRFTATTGNLFVDAQQITKILEGKY